MEYNRFLIYATYVIIYANDTACNAALELEKHVADEDKETKKIYRALKRRAIGYIRFFNELVGELSWNTSEYFSSMDEKTEVFVDGIYKEIECLLVECGAEKPELYAKLEQVRILCHIAVEIHNSLMKECLKNNIKTYNLKCYSLKELKKVADSLSSWADRHFKSKIMCDISGNNKVLDIVREINKSLMSYENFFSSYELSCNVNNNNNNKHG